MIKNAPLKGAFFLSYWKKEKIIEREFIIVNWTSGMWFAIGYDAGQEKKSAGKAG